MRRHRRNPAYGPEEMARWLETECRYRNSPVVRKLARELRTAAPGDELQATYRKIERYLTKLEDTLVGGSVTFEPSAATAQDINQALIAASAGIGVSSSRRATREVIERREQGRQQLGSPGSLISGTLRTSDLLHAFLRELNGLDPVQAERYRPAAEGLVDEEAAAELVDDLIEALNNRAPPGYYFGAHPDDGSDFGFWLSGEED